MDRQSPRTITGVELSNCLFGIVQAWAKRDRGDTEGAGHVIAVLLGRMPPGTVEMLLSAISAGALPVPSPDTMDEWMEIYAAAKRGELAVTFPDGESPVLESDPSPPAVETDDEFRARLSQIVAEAEARSRPSDEERPAPPPPQEPPPPPWEVDSLEGPGPPRVAVRVAAQDGADVGGQWAGPKTRRSALC
jgi:hypothetical protein